MRCSRVAVIAVSGLLLGCSGYSEPDADNELPRAEAALEVPAPVGPPRSVWSGVYSPEQGARGRQAYVDACSGCHLPDLSGGGVAPPLRGDAFLVERYGSTVGDLHALIRSTMPLDQAFSLSPQTYVDILAYVLSENGIPSGDTELQASQEFLDLIRIDSVG